MNDFQHQHQFDRQQKQILRNEKMLGYGQANMKPTIENPTEFDIWWKKEGLAITNMAFPIKSDYELAKLVASIAFNSGYIQKLKGIKMNAKQMIDSIESMAQQHYKDGNATDRLAWQVGALQAKISEISYHYNLLVDELKITQIELSKEQS